MIPKPAVTFLFLFFCSIAIAQKPAKKLSIAIGPNLAFGLKNPGKVTDYGVGGEVQAEVMLNEKLSIPFSAGYMYFSEVVVFASSSNGENIGVVPLLTGLRFYPATRFFLGTKLGYGRKLNIDKESIFIFQPQIGYNSRRIQLSFGYMGMARKNRTTTSWLLGFLVKLN